MDVYQVGVCPVTEDGKLVLITSRGSGYWIFPKGKVEKGREDFDVAEDEAYEEAGILGDVGKEYQSFPVCSSKSLKLHLYPMRVKMLLSRWPEVDERERRVVSYHKARDLLSGDLSEALKAMWKEWLKHDASRWLEE